MWSILLFGDDIVLVPGALTKPKQALEASYAIRGSEAPKQVWLPISMWQEPITGRQSSILIEDSHAIYDQLVLVRSRSTRTRA